MDVINIRPIAVTSQVLDPNGNCVASKQYSLCASCNLNLIQGHDTVPFLLGMDQIWIKVAERPNQSLSLCLEFKVMNYEGEEYIQRIQIAMVNAYQNNSLTPAIYDKKVFKSELFT